MDSSRDARVARSNEADVERGRDPAMTTGQARVTLGPAGFAQSLASAARLPLLLAGAACVGVVAVSRPEWWRAALAVALVLNLVVVAMRWPRAAVLATFLFLPFLALVRRLLISSSGFASEDPLLLVGPLVALFLLYRLHVVEGRRRGSDRLSVLVAAVLAVALLQVLNPLAVGGVVAAVGGLLFVAAPLLWFFVGRELGDRRTVTRVLYGTIAVACVVALYGLYQTQFAAPLPWDRAWLDVNGYGALNVGLSNTGNSIRPFSTFSSNQEYATWLAIGVTFVVALALHWRLAAMAALPLLAVALVLAGGRSSIVLAILTVMVLLALRTRSLLSGFVVVVLGIGLAFGSALALGPRLDRAAGLSGNAIIERNVTGVLKPLDPSKSTVLTHWHAVVDGFVDALKNPAGHGTGATTLAVRLSEGDSIDTENDLSNAFLSLGIVGGLLYLAVIVTMFRTVFARYVASRDVLVFAVAGLLVVVFGNWLTGALYAVTPLFWFLAGWATRPPDAAASP